MIRRPSFALALSLSLIFFGEFAQSQTSNSLDVGINVISHGVGKIAKDANGTTGFGTTYYNLQAQFHFPVSPEWSLGPELIWMPEFLMPRKEPESSIKTSFLILGIPALYRVSDAISLSIGPAYVSYSITGSGGTTQLSNGNSTSTFALPAGSVSAKTLAVLAGVNIRYQGFRFSIDTMTEGALSNTRRTLSLLLTASYNIWGSQ